MNETELRNHYAGLAMQAILTNQPLFLKVLDTYGEEFTGTGAVSCEAFKMAQAMIEESKKFEQ